MSRRALRIGITIGLHAPDQSLWVNGILQNALYLAKALRGSPLGHEVVLLNTTGVPVSEDASWNLIACPVAHIDTCDTRFDVVIELGGQINTEQTRRFHAESTKIVSYCCGSEYVMFMEAILFRRRLKDQVFINQEYDALWVIPQVACTAQHFFQTLRRVPAKVAPFVWDPIGIEHACRDIAHGGVWQPLDGPKRISVLEPNIDVLKFCLYPILIVEEAFRQRPDDIAFLHVANAESYVREDTEFAGLMRYLDIVNAHKASFIGPVNTPRFLAQYTDIVVSHQWELPLNYLYLECCWQGYPLLHNSELIRDLGFYYRGNDVAAGAKLLTSILTRSTPTLENWREQQRHGLRRFLASSPVLIAAYDDLLFELVDGQALADFQARKQMHVAR